MFYNGEGGIVLEKRERSPLSPDLNIINKIHKNLGQQGSEK